MLSVSLLVCAAVGLSGATEQGGGGGGTSVASVASRIGTNDGGLMGGGPRLGLGGRISRRPMAAEDSFAAVFFGQLFAWLCAFVAFYTSDPRYARLQSDSATPALFALQLLPMAAAFLVVAALGLAMAATVPLLHSPGFRFGSSTPLVNCDTANFRNYFSVGSPDDVVAIFFTQR